jgi:3-hydroxyisobutyrate dehydrogenase-like beta-hydroxyacid dehydrogenase
METVGFVGIGRIGMAISENLIKSGYRVVGWRRSSLAEFEKIGGVPARSPADVGAQCDIVLSCMPSPQALDHIVGGQDGLAQSARLGQILIELGSHPPAVKERQVAALKGKGAIFLDGEISGTPGMVAARKGVVYLAGDAEACKKVERVVSGFADSCLYFGEFGAASKVKLVNNLLVGVHIVAAAEAMALGLKAGVDPDLMIKAVATGSGGSTQFGIRAPWMAAKRYFPAHGMPSDFFHYFHMIHDFAADVGTVTPMMDRAMEIMQRAVDTGFGDHDHAALVEVIGTWPRKRRSAPSRRGKGNGQGTPKRHARPHRVQPKRRRTGSRPTRPKRLPAKRKQAKR